MGFPPCRSRKRPSPPEGRGPDFGPLRALHLKRTFLPACHRKVSTDMLAIGFSPCLSKKRPSQGPNGQALRNLAEKNRPRWPHFRLGLLAGSPSRKPNRTARKAIKDEHKKEQPVCPRCVQAMARDVCSICTNAKLTYAREWQEAPTPHSPVYPRSALNDVLPQTT